jgi:DNA-binding NarL/FixJ family response regulator
MLTPIRVDDHNGGQPETPDGNSVRLQLERVLDNRLFRQSPRLAKFFTYTVEQALTGSEQRLKEYSVALEVFGKPDSFDPRMDSAVRVAARQLRAKVDLYYLTDGAHDPVLIRYRPGDYAPRFYYRSSEPAHETVLELKSARVAAIVHKDRTTVRQITDALDSAGVPIAAVVDTGERTLAMLPSLGPAFVITGLDLAGAMNGPALVDELRKNGDIASIAVLPYMADPELIQQLIAAEPGAVVYQPVRPSDLATAIRIASMRLELAHLHSLDALDGHLRKIH